MLTDNGSNPCELRLLVEEILQPFADHGGISIEGPAVPISTDGCTPLVMAIHELATNASKYSSLSVPEERVDFSRGITDSDGGGVTLAWKERNGPLVEPQRRQGMGTRLINRHAAFKAATLEFPSDGARRSITLKSGAVRTRGAIQREN